MLDCQCHVKAIAKVTFGMRVVNNLRNTKCWGRHDRGRYALGFSVMRLHELRLYAVLYR